jgi:hypothetical protein
MRLAPTVAEAPRHHQHLLGEPRASRPGRRPRCGSRPADDDDALLDLEQAAAPAREVAGPGADRASPSAKRPAFIRRQRPGQQRAREQLGAACRSCSRLALADQRVEDVDGDQAGAAADVGGHGAGGQRADPVGGGGAGGGALGDRDPGDQLAAGGEVAGQLDVGVDRQLGRRRGGGRALEPGGAGGGVAERGGDGAGDQLEPGRQQRVAPAAGGDQLAGGVVGAADRGVGEIEIAAGLSLGGGADRELERLGPGADRVVVIGEDVGEAVVGGAVDRGQRVGHRAVGPPPGPGRHQVVHALPHHRAGHEPQIVADRDVAILTAAAGPSRRRGRRRPPPRRRWWRR